MTIFTFFNKFADQCIKNNHLDTFNRKAISIDFSSKSRQGDVSSNFYLVVIKKILDTQFNLKDELLKGLDELKNWPNKVKTMQKNWIGKSTGVEINFEIKKFGVVLYNPISFIDLDRLYNQEMVIIT